VTSDTVAPDTGTSDTHPPLDLVVPAAEHLPPEPAETRLAALYDAGPPGTRHLRVNMVAGVDGAAWGPDHRSGSINDAPDWRVFRVLRAMADVVLVGAGTARTEHYTTLDRPAGLEHLAGGRPLELALVTRTGRLPAGVVDDDRPAYVLTGREGAAAAADAVGRERVIEVPAGDGDVDLAAGLDALAERGLTRVLSEGGPTLLGAMLEDGLVDELCVTTTPQLVGPGPGRIVAGPGPVGASSPPPVPARLGHLLVAPGTGTLLARWELRPAATATVLP
jgi:riboflavin biosynthesis pyrimidine reductase